jgi:hypothetical protein
MRTGDAVSGREKVETRAHERGWFGKAARVAVLLMLRAFPVVPPADAAYISTGTAVGRHQSRNSRLRFLRK